MPPTSTIDLTADDSDHTTPRTRRRLIAHKKERRPNKRFMTDEAHIALLLKDADESAARFEQLPLMINIEKNDPKTLEEAIARVLEDMDDLFYGMEVSALLSHFFSSIKTTPTYDQPILEGHGSRWMTRWIVRGPGHTERPLDQWIRLVGFTGEYLVTTFYRDILICRFTASSKPCFRTLKSRTGRAG